MSQRRCDGGSTSDRSESTILLLVLKMEDGIASEGTQAVSRSWKGMEVESSLELP